ncbi:MAG: SDR family oxidoreductase, partial [Proteobacteria bacterium]|nr:SDR family oxidoreductase [Pseudomonadota bacterium]
MMSAPAYPPPRNLLAGKSVVITAAAGAGIGYSTARRAIEEGAEVLISDVHERRLNEAADRIAQETGRRPITTMCDVTNEADVQRLRDEAIAAFGRVVHHHARTPCIHRRKKCAAHAKYARQGNVE